MAKLTFENKHGTYSIELTDSEVEVYHDFIEFLVQPLSLAAGWHPETVTNALFPELND